MTLQRALLIIILAALSQGASSQTLKEALDKKDTVAVLQLLKKGGNVNIADENGTTPLMNACRWADEAMVHFLLAHGATPDRPRSPKGRTPLMIACAYYSGKSICSMLIDKGADVNAFANDGSTPLMLAAQNAKLDVVALLLKKGARPNTKDTNGKTALDYANQADVSDYLKQSVKDTQLDKQGVITLLQNAMK